jgi:hypothetical protein
VNRAVLSLYSKVGLDIKKIKFLAKTCKQLEYLECYGGGFVGESLVEALPLARNLKTLVLSDRCEVTKQTVSQILKSSPQLSSVEFNAIELKSYGRIDFPKMESLETLKLRRVGKYAAREMLFIVSIELYGSKSNHLLCLE